MQASLPDNVAPTSVVTHMLSRMQAAHRRQKIAIFTGPPGIGKTTAIRALAHEYPDRIAIVSLPGRKVKGTAVMRRVIQELRRMNGYDPDTYIPTCGMALSRELAGQLHTWRNYRLGEPLLTIVFDEAQTLSREAVETMRFYNDAAAHDAPFPVGLIFVGNHELSLRVDDKGQSTISAAVSSRAIVKQDYSDALHERQILTETDFRLVIESYGIHNPEACALLIRFCASLWPRDFRVLTEMTLPDILDAAGGKPVTAEHVRSVLFIA